MADSVIRSFCLCPMHSKTWGASDQSVRELYLEEVRLSDIYVGIFGLQDSSPSRDEYEAARAQQLPTLVFIKQLHEKDTRDQQLESFLTKIKDPRAGVTIDDYTQVIDFQNKLASSLSNLLSREFHRAKTCEDKMIELEAELEQPKTAVDAQLEIKPMPIFTSFKIPPTIEIGKPTNVSATVIGSSTNAFLDLKLVSEDGKIKYYPDHQSWDSKLDYGTLNLEADKPYQNEWGFVISKHYKPGKYKAIMQLYEDSGKPPNKERKLVAYEEKDIEVKEA